MNWELIAMLALAVVAYSIGKGIGRAQGSDRASRTVIVVQLDGTTVGHVSISGVTVIPGADYLPLPPTPDD